MSTPETVSAEDVAALRRELAELRSAYDDLRNARTPAEKQEAREDVHEAKADLNALARELGLDPERLREAAEKAKDEEDYERMSRHIERYLSSLPDDDEPEDKDSGGTPKAGDGDDQPNEPPAQADPPKEPKAKREPKPPADSEPVVPHWTEKRVTELLK